MSFFLKVLTCARESCNWANEYLKLKNPSGNKHLLSPTIKVLVGGKHKIKDMSLAGES